jgi:hypothetical protein
MLYVEPNFNPLFSVPTEIRFDAAHPQKAYRLRRIAGTGYVIQSFDNVPFTAWDISDSLNPRQLTVAWRDYDLDGTWNLNSGYEYTFIYYKSYDSTGTTQFTMPPSAIGNECTVGEKADIMYCIQEDLRSGHILNESTGKMYIRPYIAPSAEDKYTFNPTSASSEQQGLTPKNFSLSQNFPNPFNPSTTINFQIPTKGTVKLKIYNLLGQEIIELVNAEMDAGVHQIVWNGKNKTNVQVASGLYFYRLTSGQNFSTKKMVLIK